MVGPRLPKLNFLALATSITTTSSCNRSKSRLNARVTVDIDLLLTQLAHPTRHHEPSRPCRSLIARWFSCKALSDPATNIGTFQNICNTTDTNNASAGTFHPSAYANIPTFLLLDDTPDAPGGQIVLL
ncbi:hypothetical protein SNOG_07121 [Parastagonospora nodorum SN15]|uniref:Uncharacterized protein n=1 Tax=Phaeosphaeria nodorum (strain SN15 / ATCC MYA-4574 / FGSC 10173) TaxID=321614 RepID=Q0UM93_PHANO|nr:hypothetical protein SNOG_07121 [Parastagonospora nodorum SN15]EAT85772.1 hypothetical protein SNOG_07121 [Parastagonospora nodorum SN15]